MRHLLRVVGLAALFLGLLGGCGTDNGASEDPESLLEDASVASAGVTSGEVDARVSLGISAEHLSQGSSLRLQGPFVRPTGQAPSFRFKGTVAEEGLAASVSDASSRTHFVLIAGTDAAFLQIGNKGYEVASAVFRRFQQLLAPTSKTGGIQPTPDLSAWFIEPSNEGTDHLGDTEVVHISGSADTEQIASDLAVLAEGLGVEQGSELEGIGKSFDEATIDLYLGPEDHVPRRVEVGLNWNGRLEGGEPFDGSIDASISLSEIGEPQEIKLPDGAQPVREGSVDELPAQLSGLGEFLAGGPRG